MEFKERWGFWLSDVGRNVPVFEAARCVMWPSPGGPVDQALERLTQREKADAQSAAKARAEADFENAMSFLARRRERKG